MTGWIASHCLKRSFGHSCRLNRWRKGLLKIATKSWRDNHLLHNSFLSFVDAALRYYHLPAVRKSIESFPLRPCNLKYPAPPERAPLPPFSTDLMKMSFTHQWGALPILWQLRPQIAPSPNLSPTPNPCAFSPEVSLSTSRSKEKYLCH